MMAVGENAKRLTDENMDSFSVFETVMKRRRRGGERGGSGRKRTERREGGEECF